MKDESLPALTPSNTLSVDLSMESLNTLQTLALEATPGPWSYNGNCRFGVWQNEGKFYVFEAGGHADAAYTAAANPAVMLALVNVARAHLFPSTQRVVEVQPGHAFIAPPGTAVRHLEAPKERSVWATGPSARCANCGQSLIEHQDQRYCMTPPRAPDKLDEAVLRRLIENVAVASNQNCGDASEAREQQVKAAEKAEEELLAYVRAIAATTTQE